MVGTSATVAFLARRPSRARRKAGTVRTTRGLRGISARFCGGIWGGGGVGRDLGGGGGASFRRREPCRQGDEPPATNRRGQRSCMGSCPAAAIARARASSAKASDG